VPDADGSAAEAAGGRARPRGRHRAASRERSPRAERRAGAARRARHSGTRTRAGLWSSGFRTRAVGSWWGRGSGARERAVRYPRPGSAAANRAPDPRGSAAPGAAGLPGTAGPAGAAVPDRYREFTSAEDTGETLLDVVGAGVAMLDASGRVVLWSREAERLLGWPSQHLIGRNLEEIVAESVESDYAGETREQVLRGRIWRGRIALLSREGERVVVVARISSLVNGDGVPFLQIWFAEASAVRELEEDLAVRDALFDQSPLGIAIYDSDLRYVRVNETLARMNGISAEEHVGQTVGENLSGEAADEASAIQRQVLATGTPVIDLIVGQSAAGERGPGFRSVSYSRLTDRAGRVLGITGTIMDVTDRYRAIARVEQARQRLSLLNEVGSRIGDLLDSSRIARELAAVLVPRFADYAAVLLLEPVARGGDLSRHLLLRDARLVVTGTAAYRDSPRADTLLQTGKLVPPSENSVLFRVLSTGRLEHLDSLAKLTEGMDVGSTEPRMAAAMDLGVHASLVVPLRARGIVLGLIVLGRAGRRESFDPDETAFATEVADRAGASLENARLYARERTAALMLQRSLLPQRVAPQPGVEVAYRYVPASSGAEVGGDWFDVIQLPGGRTALVVGDVMGHSLRAAATMGRLRTAVRTLAGLDLPPARVLQQLQDLADDLAAGPEAGHIATVVYAVYDPAERTLCTARAGHPPPMLVEPGGRARVLDLPAGAPIGVGGVPFESAEREVPPGTLLVLYTDGLVESRDADIDVGIGRLGRVVERQYASLEAACETVIGTLEQGQEPDDVALLLARLDVVTAPRDTSPQRPSTRATAAEAAAPTEAEAAAPTEAEAAPATPPGPAAAPAPASAPAAQPAPAGPAAAPAAPAAAPAGPAAAPSGAAGSRAPEAPAAPPAQAEPSGRAAAPDERRESAAPVAEPSGQAGPSAGRAEAPASAGPAAPGAPAESAGDAGRAATPAAAGSAAPAATSGPTDSRTVAGPADRARPAGPAGTAAPAGSVEPGAADAAGTAAPTGSASPPAPPAPPAEGAPLGPDGGRAAPAGPPGPDAVSAADGPAARTSAPAEPSAPKSPDAPSASGGPAGGRTVPAVPAAPTEPCGPPAPPSEAGPGDQPEAAASSSCPAPASPAPASADADTDTPGGAVAADGPPTRGAAVRATARWELAAEPSAVGRARRLLREVLAEWGLQDLSADAQLLVSELVTNAVRYASAPIWLEVNHTADHLLVEVADPIPQHPQERDARHTDEGGRGLHLVRRMADRWGTRPVGRGKAVWFELTLPGGDSRE